MARIRTIKPDFWKHEELSALPEATHMLAAALLNYADDEGYFNANAKLVQAECCPLREPSVSVHDSLIALAQAGYIRLGTGSDGKRYGHVLKFDEHQRINRKTESKIKDIEISWEDSVSTHTQCSESSHPEGKGREGERNGKEVRADARPAEYAFAGQVVRLRQKEFDQWERAYSRLDLMSELTARDTWLVSSEATDEDRKKWFITTSKYLANRNAEARLKGRNSSDEEIYRGVM